MARINALKDFSKHTDRSDKHIFRDNTTVCKLQCKKGSTPDKHHFTSIEIVHMYTVFEQVDCKIPEHAFL